MSTAQTAKYCNTDAGVYAGKLNVVDGLALTFCFLSLQYICCSRDLVPQQTIPFKSSILIPSDLSEESMVGTGFGPNAVYPTTSPVADPNKVQFFGSWLGGNAATGATHTRWYRPADHIGIYAAGYPGVTGNELYVEVETASNETIRLPVTDPTPGESWSVQELSLRAIRNPTRLRLVAVDGSSQFWLGFSQPFAIVQTDNLELCKQWLLTGLSMVTAFVVFLSPGLLLRQRAPKLAFVWVPLPGILLSALLGLLAWKGPNQLPPALISRICLIAFISFAIVRFVRAPLSGFLTRIEKQVLLIVILLSLVGVAKSLYSLDPVGDLYGGRISRSLEVGGRSDSRVPYVVVQLIALRKSGYSELANVLFSPWNFSSRGPISGLAVSPLVLVGPVSVPPSFPDQPWTLFDPEGFTAYRVSMIVISCISLVTVFGLATLLMSPQWAFLTFLVAVSSPFTLHEIFFTWPKLLSSAFVLAGAYSVFRSRFLLAGLCVGVGYLCHPSALIWGSMLVAIIVLLARKKAPFSMAESGLYTALFGLGLLPVIWFWTHVNHGHNSQAGFLSFFTMAGMRPVTVHNWLVSRWHSLANTLIPFYLYAFDRTDPSVNSIVGTSPTIVQLSFLYWNTLPFGIGIAFYCLCVWRLLWTAANNCLSWLIWIVIVPFAFFALYMGFVSTGLLRDGLHTWFLGFIIFLVVVWNKFPIHSDRYWRVCSWSLLSRVVELPIMLIAPSAISHHMTYQIRYKISDLMSLTVMIAGCTVIAMSAYRCSENLRLAK